VYIRLVCKLGQEDTVMAKKFCITGTCVPEKNYMVDISDRIDRITKDYIEQGQYFTINRARQYGKTTTLFLLERKLREDYLVLSLSFEAADEYFESLTSLAEGLVLDIGECLREQNVAEKTVNDWISPLSEKFPMRSLGMKITSLCKSCGKKIVLMIDEVDKSSDNQIFLSFLGLLREKYLKWQQGKDSTFQSVVLAGVHDVKTLKLKLHPQEESKYNSPWNIAVDFRLDMSFSVKDIESMLNEYEQDHQTGMNIRKISQLIYDYTSGYPYLVSRMCQIMDERILGTDEFLTNVLVWTKEGVLEAVKLLLKEPNTLFDDMTKKLLDYPKLKEMMQSILFSGVSFPFKRETPLINLGVTFGFLKDNHGIVAISNRIFETQLYDLFLAEMAINDAMYVAAVSDRNQFIISGMLQMDLVMKKFYEHFEEIYSDNDQKFIEENGRKLFLLYLKPIINGTGNYYIEARTRDNKRTDIIIDYRGKQFIIELKIWHGDEYNKRGEKQLFEYLEIYKQERGYLLSFNFNKQKKTGIHEIRYKEKKILEVVV
jgi:hypothetical protein